jgi:hypothetical protein
MNGLLKYQFQEDFMGPRTLAASFVLMLSAAVIAVAQGPLLSEPGLLPDLLVSEPGAESPLPAIRERRFVPKLMKGA